MHERICPFIHSTRIPVLCARGLAASINGSTTCELWYPVLSYIRSGVWCRGTGETYERIDDVEFYRPCPCRDRNQGQ